MVGLPQLSQDAGASAAIELVMDDYCTCNSEFQLAFYKPGSPKAGGL